FGLRPDRRREPVAPLPGAGRVDDEPAVEALLPGLDGRVEWAAPGAVDEVQAPLRIGPRADRPDDLVQVGDVDVVVDDHRDAAEIGAAAALAGDVPGLARVARVALLDGNHVEQPAAADPVAPGGRHVRDAGQAQLTTEIRAAQVLAEAVRLVGRFLRRAAQDDGVVAMVNGLHLEDRLLARGGG